MTAPVKLDPDFVASHLNDGTITLIDIRTAIEFTSEHIQGAISLPLSTLEKGGLQIESDKKAVFYCLSGMRTQKNCEHLTRHVQGEVYILDGGMNAWKEAGLVMHSPTASSVVINRQVHISAGAIILSGVLLAKDFHPGFLVMTAMVGAGLIIAGVSGWCGMEKLLNVMPWNNKTQQPS